MKLELSRMEEVYRGFFRLLKARLRYQRFGGGMSREVELEVLERGDAVAVILYDPVLDQVGLIRQFRIGPHLRQESGWIVEIVAGSCGQERDTSQVARREVAEETGWRIRKLEFIQTFYLSPSGSSERIHLYCGLFDASLPRHQGGGLEQEDEDIEPLLVPFATVLEWMSQRRTFNSAIVLLAMQWLTLHRERLRIEVSTP
ncbi:MAG: NUDIX domain-containing protein [Magnetococcales bacterium]|nr:NUDIX domain-containing protein [Magnetococcales bacterium]